MKFSRRYFVHAGCTAGIVSLVPHFLDRAEAGLHFHGTLPTYEGLVASRARILTTNDTTNKFLMARSAHLATENLTAVKTVFSNFYLTAGGELGNGAASTITASVEYPAGTFTQITFSASATGTIPNASLLFSDYASVSIPSGATFWIRSFIQNTGGLVYNAWQNTFLGEATALSATTISDQTLSGTITNSGAFSFPPIAILAITSNPSVMIVGDSIAVGVPSDSEDSSNSATGFNAKVGIVARSMGNVPFVNLARFGEQAGDWGLGQAAARAQLIQKSSHVFCEMGINDLHLGGVSVATLIASLQAIYARTATWQKVYQTTLTPFTSSSTDGWTTLGGQTIDAGSNPNRVSFNTSLRGGSVTGQNFKGFVETADVLESSRNSGLWRVTPSPPYTTDGIHPDIAGYAIVAAANVYPPIVFP